MSPARSRSGRAVAALVVGLAAVALPAVARADGDPASDVLVAAPPLFISAGSGAGYAQKVAIVDQLDAAARSGHALRVAIISRRSDLGSVGALWNRPQQYADFLGRELSLQYHGRLLVVMPAGFGVSQGGAPVAGPLSGLAPRSGELLTATEQAIRRLTGASAPGARVVAVSGPSRVTGVGWWAATLVAVAIVVGAWAGSLRRRPPRVRRASHPSAG